MPKEAQQQPHSQAVATVSTVSPTLLAAAKRIDELAAGAVDLFKEAGSFAAELAVARTMQDLRAALTPEVMAPVMALMNTDLGFRTDRDPSQKNTKTGEYNKPYSVDVVREVFIESKLRGFHTVGNEFNIIACRFYGAKNGFRRKVTRFEGISEFKDSYDVPRNANGGAIVKCKATWKLNGAPDSIECEIPVKINEFMGTDAILGKAERKLLKRVHDRLTGTNTPDGDLSDEPHIDIESEKVEPKFGKAAEKAAEPEKPQPAAAPEQQPGEMETPQGKLAKLCIEAGFTFDHWYKWAISSGNLPDSDETVIDFYSVPTVLAELCIKSQTGLLRGLAVQKGGAQ